MESKKISNDQEFIQPDSIFLPQKEKKFTRHTRYIHKNLVTTLECHGKQKVTTGWAEEGWASEAADGGLVPRAVVRGLNYFAAKKGFDCHASV